MLVIKLGCDCGRLTARREYRFDGDITIELSSGLSVRVENSQFVGPDMTIDQDTGGLLLSRSEPDIAMNALQDSNASDVITIGRNFFSAAYISINYDIGTFTMWNANATSNQNLVAVDTAGKEQANYCTSQDPTATATATGASSTANGGGSVKISGSGSNNAANPSAVIAGGVVGGLAGAALVCLVMWWAYKTRRTKQARSVSTNPHFSELQFQDPSQASDSPSLKRSFAVHEQPAFSKQGQHQQEHALYELACTSPAAPGGWLELTTA